MLAVCRRDFEKVRLEHERRDDRDVGAGDCFIALGAMLSHDPHGAPELGGSAGTGPRVLDARSAVSKVPESTMMGRLGTSFHQVQHARGVPKPPFK